MKDTKASLHFDRDVLIVRGEGKTVTLSLWTDGGAKYDALSEEFTSSDREYADEETESEGSSGNNYVNECGPIGEAYMVFLTKIEEAT